MRVIGVDPGIVVTGFGIIDKKNNNIIAHSYGTVKPPKTMSLSDRLGYLYDEISSLLDKYKPNMLAVEDTFYSKNFKSAMLLGQARGSIILAGYCANVSCIEFSPKKIKKSVVGNGNASKEQVQYMVKNILHLDKLPTPLDASDALAIGLCYLNQNSI
ncbi:MAG: crossover junction endodeoxyribonuclease RuvC [Candidatus Neomarinimicrobiota bacterium]|nr:MAG: crossover junction endodeoxyribonuclease RuvC [bacterium]|tara:strand:+ start:197 stop:670 length:474 start_codon:yes stop_codon:yes gene_type:complete